MNFLLLVIAALAGMVAKVFLGWDPWKLIGAFGLMLIVLPILGLAFIHDPQALQAATNSNIERIVNSIPSTVIGEVAGFVAGTIFDIFKGLFP